MEKEREEGDEYQNPIYGNKIINEEGQKEEEDEDAKQEKGFRK